MTPELWQTLTPEQQADDCWREFGVMLREALDSIRFMAGNSETEVINGGTTIITRRATS